MSVQNDIFCFATAPFVIGHRLPIFRCDIRVDHIHDHDRDQHADHREQLRQRERQHAADHARDDHGNAGEKLTLLPHRVVLHAPLLPHADEGVFPHHRHQVSDKDEEYAERRQQKTIEPELPDILDRVRLNVQDKTIQRIEEQDRRRPDVQRDPLVQLLLYQLRRQEEDQPYDQDDRQKNQNLILAPV